MADAVVSIDRITKAGHIVDFEDPSCNIRRKRDGSVIGHSREPQYMYGVAAMLAVSEDIYTVSAKVRVDAYMSSVESRFQRREGEKMGCSPALPLYCILLLLEGLYTC